MRVYHFVNEQYGLEDLRLRRIKVATFRDLNDPFELFALNFADPQLRMAFRHLKEKLHHSAGLLCFSRTWSNPVQWSHYADRHRGLCLGFEVPDRLLRAVSYKAKRLLDDANQLLQAGPHDEELMMRLLSTKYSHWRYEQESRVFVSLDKPDLESGLFFAEFSEELKLEHVIVGSESSLGRAKLDDALGEMAPVVKKDKARLAFRSFRVVRQRAQREWA